MKKGWYFLLAVILGAGFCYGIIQLFVIRFSLGDIYPPGSSLRADGLGTKALHDSLKELLPVERNERQLSQLSMEGKTTLFMFDTTEGQFETDSISSDLDVPVHAGARLVIAFSPVAGKKDGETGRDGDKGKDTAKKKDTEKGRDGEKMDAGELEVGTGKLWGVKVAYLDKLPTKARAEVPTVEPEASWHSLMYFETTEPGWRVLYSCDKKPVVIERSFGRGAIVLVADSYLFSNEALSKERLPQFLSSITGPASRVIFEETHLGVVEHPGTVALIRRYRLHGVVLALLLVAALFVWRNAVPFVPPYIGHAGQTGTVEGRCAAEGFVSLLKRSIPPRQLVGECMAEWKRSAGRRVKPGVLLRVEAAASDGAKQPVEIYQTIVEILNEKK